MKSILLGAVALLALAGSAAAADMQPRPYTKAPAYTPPQVIYNWTGFYIGGHVGGAFAGDSSFQSSDARFLGGVQGGFDYQFAPNWVVGIEAQYSWLPTNNNGATFPLGTQVTSNTDQLGSVTGRIGYTWGPTLLYAKGGYAWRNGGLGVNVAGVPTGFTATGNNKDGYTVGAGLEYMFAPNWSAKAEYMYYNFGDARFTAPAALVPAGSFTTDDHVFKAGVNYRINWAGPVTARY